jgi:hypothetical protein
MFSNAPIAVAIPKRGVCRPIGGIIEILALRCKVSQFLVRNDFHVMGILEISRVLSPRGRVHKFRWEKLRVHPAAKHRAYQGHMPRIFDPDPKPVLSINNSILFKLFEPDVWILVEKLFHKNNVICSVPRPKLTVILQPHKISFQLILF